MAGKLIVLEGTDGSGKSTQFRRLCQRMDTEGKPFRRIVFPRYQEESSALIRLYLNGSFGTHPEDVNAYAASSFYAVDRYASYVQDWGQAYQAGEIILSDRYTTSNAVHQGSKVPEEEREAFFRWLYEYEYDRLGLPKPDLVCYLDMPTDCAVSLLRARETATHTHADIHERDDGYLAQCRSCAREAARVLGWQRIPCVDGQSRLRTVEEIHQEIWAAVCRLL
ncbi:MAG: dTMP kinase [Candidatus Onthomonas sp.]